MKLDLGCEVACLKLQNDLRGKYSYFFRVGVQGLLLSMLGVRDSLRSGISAR